MAGIATLIFLKKSNLIFPLSTLRLCSLVTIPSEAVYLHLRRVFTELEMVLSVNNQ